MEEGASMQRTALVALVTMLLVAVEGLDDPVLETTTLQEALFEGLDPQAPNQIVLFYHGEQDASLKAVRATDDGTAIIAMTDHPGLKFLKCDVSKPENIDAVAKTGMSGFPLLFISIEGQGVDRYMEEFDEGVIYEYIAKKLEPVDENDVLPFEETNVQFPGNPVIIKFFENWCGRCSAMKKAFQQVATEFKDQIRLVEVECSSSPDTQAFCQKHGVDEFPTVKLLPEPGSRKEMKFAGPFTYPGFLSFIKEQNLLSQTCSS